MKNLVKFFSILLLAQSFSFAYSVKDAGGKVFEISENLRVACISPSVTQNIASIGAESHIVGVSRYCDYPESVKKLPKIGGLLDLDFELLMSLNPDFLIMQDISDAATERRLSRLGIKVFKLNKEGFENICSDIRILGELFNRKEKAERLAREFEGKIESIRGENPAKSRSALFLFFGNVFAGKGSYVDGIMQICGLKNAAAKAGAPWPILSREFILTSDIDMLFIELPPNSSAKETVANLKRDAVWSNMRAVRENRVCCIPRELIVVPSLRVLDAIEIMKVFLETQSGNTLN